MHCYDCTHLLFKVVAGMQYRMTVKPEGDECKVLTLVVGDQPWNTPRYRLNTELSVVAAC